MSWISNGAVVAILLMGGLSADNASAQLDAATSVNGVLTVSIEHLNVAGGWFAPYYTEDSIDLPAVGDFDFIASSHSRRAHLIEGAWSTQGEVLLWATWHGDQWLVFEDFKLVAEPDGEWVFYGSTTKDTVGPVMTDMPVLTIDDETAVLHVTADGALSLQAEIVVHPEFAEHIGVVEPAVIPSLGVMRLIAVSTDLTSHQATSESSNSESSNSNMVPSDQPESAAPQRAKPSERSPNR